MLFEKRDTTEQNWKQKILIALFSILLFLMIDYMVRGSESFIQVSIISKLFSSKNKVSLDSSGMARADLIFLALQSMVRHPFGVGYSNLVALMDVENTGIREMQYLWGVGIVGVLVLMIVFKPLAKERLLLVGAGGFGRVVSELARQSFDCAFVDDGVEVGTIICDIPVIGQTADLHNLFAEYKNLVIVIGNNSVRERMTYHEDVAAVKDSFKRMLENGVYKTDLFSDL